MTENQLTDVRFTDFFRRYTKTWIHAVATAGLTAFGTLTFVNRWFAVLAIGSYVIPPVVLYARANSTAEPDAEQRGSAQPASSDSDPETTTDHDTSTTTETDTPDHGIADSTGEETTGPSMRTENRPDGPTSERTAETSAPEEAAERAGSPDEPEAESPERDAKPDDQEEGSKQESESGSDGEDEEICWAAVETPTTVTLSDVAVTARTASAVGEGGVVLTRAEESGEWTVALEDGPAAQSNDLHGVDAAGDDAVWVAGDSGALARIETDTGRHVDYSAPKDITDNWMGIAVGVSADDETVLVINGSGEVLQGRYRDGKLDWGSTVTPGSGSSLSGIDLYSSSGGFCCDTNDGVFETTDGGESFETVGVDGADGTLTDIAAVGAGECLVSADDGVVHRYDGTNWTPERVGTGTLAAIARQGEYTVTCGEVGIYERTAPIEDWVQYESDGEGALFGVGATADRVVAVGTEGVVVERSVGPLGPD